MATEAFIDLETWGVRTTSIVRSVGIVLFDGDAELGRLYFRTDEDEQAERGRTKDMSTVFWWRKPENADAQAIIAEAPLWSHEEAQRELQRIGRDVVHVWSKPGMFDLPMMRDCFGQEIWPYWKERDLATLLGEFDPERKYSKPKFIGTPHVAIDDAVHGMLWLQRFRALHRAGLMSIQGPGA